MNKYAAQGNGSNSVSPQANLYTGGGSSPSIRVYGFTVGFELMSSPGNPIAGIRYMLANAINSGNLWGGLNTPTPLDPKSPPSQTTLGFGGAGTPPSVGSTYVQFGVYLKGLVNWQAKKGKEIAVSGGGAGCALLIAGIASSIANIDYCFLFEE